MLPFLVLRGVSHRQVISKGYLPAQEIRDGVVTIGIREGVIGQVIAEPDSNVRLSRELIARHLDGLHPGDVIQEGDLENTLLRISDIAGVSIKAVLRPSAQAGATDIIVKISEMSAITSRVSIDNGGSYYTGANRLADGLLLITANAASGNAFSQSSDVTTVAATGSGAVLRNFGGKLGSNLTSADSAAATAVLQSEMAGSDWMAPLTDDDALFSPLGDAAGKLSISVVSPNLRAGISGLPNSSSFATGKDDETP